MKKNGKKMTALLLSAALLPGLLAGCAGNPPAGSNPGSDPGLSDEPDDIINNKETSQLTNWSAPSPAGAPLS